MGGIFLLLGLAVLAIPVVAIGAWSGQETSSGYLTTANLNTSAQYPI